MKLTTKHLAVCTVATLLVTSGITIPKTAHADSGDIPIDAAHFPDPVFRKWISEGMTSFSGGNGDINQYIDTNRDGILSEQERNETISVFGVTGKTSGAGIELFPNLKKIEFNQGTTTGDWDFSQNKALQVLRLPKHANTVKLGDLPNLITLDSISYEGTPFDFTGCSALERFVGWYGEDISGQNKTLDFSHNPKLKLISINNARVENIDLSKNSELEKFGGAANDFKEIDFSHNKKLTEISIEHDPYLTDLKTGELPDLKQISLTDNAVTINPADFPKLQGLYVARTGIDNLDVSTNYELTYLEARGNNLTSLDLTNNLKLGTVIAEGNKLSSIALPTTSSLTELGLNKNQLTNIDVSGLTSLSTLGLNRNQLKSLDLSHNTQLRSVGVANNQLTTLDLSKNNNLVDVYADQNYLTGGVALPENGTPSDFRASEQQATAKVDADGIVDLTEIFGAGFDANLVQQPSDWNISRKGKYILYTGNGVPSYVLLGYEIAPGIVVHITVTLTAS